MNAPYVKIPQAVFDALEAHSLTPEQVDIFSYCYLHAKRPEYRVQGYSAANVCRFRWLDATPANLKRYERSAANLWSRCLIGRDYVKIDTTRTNRGGRPYSLWVPDPAKFAVVGTPNENRVSLWRSNVGLVVGDNVGLPPTANAVSAIGSEEERSGNVGLSVGLNSDMMSIKDHCAPKNIERDSPNPSKEGLLPLPSPFGGDAQPAGVQNVHTKIKDETLDADRCELLTNAALSYIDFMVDFWQFSPPRKDVEKLLRRYKPTEVLFAQVSRFEPRNYYKKDLAHFFGKAAYDRIEHARRLGTSTSIPELFLSNCDGWQDYHAKKWDAVLLAWNKIGIDGQQDEGFPNLAVAVEARQIAAAQARLARQKPAPIVTAAPPKPMVGPIPESERIGTLRGQLYWKIRDTKPPDVSAWLDEHIPTDLSESGQVELRAEVMKGLAAMVP